MSPVEFFGYAFVTLFFIVDPMGVIPMYLAMTEDFSKGERKRVTTISSIVAMFTLLAFAFGGKFIFEFFGFTLQAFRIAGGLILAIIGIEMIMGQRRSRPSEEDLENGEREGVGVVPIGIPLLAGPGAITAVMILWDDCGEVGMKFAVIFSIILVQLVSYIMLLHSDMLFKKIGKIGTVAISRIMGLMLTAIAIQFIIDGILALA